MPNRSRSGVVSRPSRVVAPTSVKGCSSIRTVRAAGPSPITRSSCEILQRRIEHLLHHRVQPVDLVDEQHVARLEIGQDRGEIARLGQHRAARSCGNSRPARARRSAPAWSCPGPGGPWNSAWSIASPRRRALSMKTREVGARLGLADEVVERLRPQRAVVLGQLVGAQGRVGLGHRSPLSPAAPGARRRESAAPRGSARRCRPPASRRPPRPRRRRASAGA